MFDFVRKKDLWRFWDSKLDQDFKQTRDFHLKTVQDLAIYDHLKDSSGLTIAEIGGGNSRLLKKLNARNTCFNIEKFEGQDGGPSKEVRIQGVKNLAVFLGENSPLLQSDFFDVVFSVSVIEHVGSRDLKSFFEDGLRILKPGGLWLHAIDLYLDQDPSEFIQHRYKHYRSWLTDARMEPVGDIFEGEAHFTTDMATNPDQTMYQWGKVAPDLIELRKQAQSVSIILAARKRG